jgi:dTDP-4-amino-4,6-dideoxygalactose transaminase
LVGLPVINPVVPWYSEPVWHLYVIRTPERAKLQATLAKKNVGTLIHYPIPPHRQNAYAVEAKAFPPLAMAESLAEEVLSLPIGPHLAPDQVNRAIVEIQEALS